MRAGGVRTIGPMTGGTATGPRWPRTRLAGAWRAATLLGLALFNLHVGMWGALLASSFLSWALEPPGATGAASPLSEFLRWGNWWDLLLMPSIGPVRLALEGDRLLLPAVGLLALHALAAAFLGAPAILAPRVPGRTSIPLWLSVVGAAIIGASLSIGGSFLLLTNVERLFRDSGAAETTAPIGVAGLLVAWCVAGIAWTVLMARAGAARNPEGIDRWVRWLLAGTAAEAAVAAPMLAVSARRDNCICSWGSWWVLCLGAAFLLMMCGPAILLLRSRESRRNWMRGACLQCGYLRRGAATRCPECGAPHHAPA